MAVLAPLRLRRRSAPAPRREVGGSIALWVCAFLGALFVAWGLTQSTVVAAAACIVVVGVSAVVLSRASVTQLGIMFALLFSFTSSWDEASLGGVKPRMIFFLLSLMLLGFGIATKRLPHVPWWLHTYALTAFFVALLQVLFPVSQDYLNQRYLLSQAGTALGLRPGVLPTLASLVVNTYAVPMLVVMVAMHSRRSLKWFVYAFVLGAALSNFAGYLGYEGHEFLLKLVVPPISPHFRAQGYTSHSLHLATSGIVTIPLACWMAIQPGFWVKWAGRIGAIAIALGLYASGSRGGAGAGLVGVALAVVFLPSVRRRMHVVIAVATVALTGLIGLLPSVGTNILQTTRIAGAQSGAASDIGRSQVASQSIQDAAHSPIWGLGIQYQAEAHILYLGMLASGGILLFVAWFLFNIGSVQDAIKVSRIDRSLGGAVLATVLSTLVYWFVADEFQVAMVGVVYGLVLALKQLPPPPEDVRDLPVDVADLPDGELVGLHHELAAVERGRSAPEWNRPDPPASP